MKSFVYFIVFLQNSYLHVHKTHQKCHYHMPLCRINLTLRYVGTSLCVNINPNVSELFFLEVLKQQYVTYFNLSQMPHVLLVYFCWLYHFYDIVRFFFLLHLLQLRWDLLYVKQPRNQLSCVQLRATRDTRHATTTMTLFATYVFLCMCSVRRDKRQVARDVSLATFGIATCSDRWRDFLEVARHFDIICTKS